MPSVFNKHHGNAPADAVYVGRPTKWGNPYSHLEGTKAEQLVPDRETAVLAYEAWLLMDNPLYDEAKRELKGKDLVCWCAPKACHANVLMRIANEV